MKLRTYIFQRILLGIPTILILLSIVFIVMRIIPGDPVEMLIGEKLSEEALEMVRHRMGLDKPLHVQYFDMISGILRGDLGITIWFRVPVTSLISRALPASLELILYGFPIGVLVGIILGMISVFYKNRFIDHIIRILSFGLYSLPGFWLCMLLQLSFGVALGWFPISGRVGTFESIKYITGIYSLDAILTGNTEGLLSCLHHIALPATVLASWMVPMTSRITRASVTETFSEQYITTARAKGLFEKQVIIRHAFRNALIPIVTTLGTSLIGLIGGAISIEFMFSWPGMGYLLVHSALQRDVPLLEGVILVYSIIVIALSTVMDVIYSLVDPRVKLGG